MNALRKCPIIQFLSNACLFTAIKSFAHLDEPPGSPRIAIRFSISKTNFTFSGRLIGHSLKSKFDIFLLSLILLPWALASGDEILAAGEGHYDFEDWGGKPVKVWHYIPEGVKADTPILFVMHGVRRDGDRYLRQWIPQAKLYGFILVVPEFSKANFPDDAGYNFGNTVTLDGKPLPREEWAFSALELIFDDIKAKTGNESVTYNLFGHSAGSQFAHRFLYFVPDARVKYVVSANAGWYTMPDHNLDFPYGLKGTVVTLDQLKRNLERPLVVLLGTEDTDPNHQSLRRTPEAMEQGRHRFERGHTFYSFAEEQAMAMEVKFGWSIKLVEGVGHKNGLMAGPAAELMYKFSEETFGRSDSE